MTDIGDLLTSRPAPCIQLLTCTQLICKRNIVVRIIVIVLSSKVNSDISLIYNKSNDFCKKTSLGSFVSVSTLFKIAELGCP